MDCSQPGSSVDGILQARILEWVAFFSPGDLSDPGIEPGFPALQADSLPSEPPGKPNYLYLYISDVFLFLISTFAFLPKELPLIFLVKPI